MIMIWGLEKIIYESNLKMLSMILEWHEPKEKRADGKILDLTLAF